MHQNQIKKTIMINTGLLAYIFTKLDDNLTNNDGDMLIENSNSTLKNIAISASMPSGLNNLPLVQHGDWTKSTNVTKMIRINLYKRICIETEKQRGDGD